MVEYSKGNAKLTDAQLKKPKTVVKDKTGTTLRMNRKTLDGNDATWNVSNNKTKSKAKKCI